MKFIIHGTWPNGTEDQITIEGDTIADILRALYQRDLWVAAGYSVHRFISGCIIVNNHLELSLGTLTQHRCQALIYNANAVIIGYAYANFGPGCFQFHIPVQHLPNEVAPQ